MLLGWEESEQRSQQNMEHSIYQGVLMGTTLRETGAVTPTLFLSVQGASRAKRFITDGCVSFVGMIFPSGTSPLFTPWSVRGMTKY